MVYLQETPRRWARRGRPRTRSLGPDLGTKELQRHQVRLVSGAEGKISLSASPLGILHSKDLISESELTAGFRYGKECVRAFRCLGAPLLKTMNYARLKEARLPSSLDFSASSLPDLKERAILHRWRLLTNVLLKQGQRVKKLVDQMTLYERTSLEPVPLCKTDLEALRQGLKALDDFYQRRG